MLLFDCEKIYGGFIMDILEEYKREHTENGIQMDYLYRLIRDKKEGEYVYGIEIVRKDYKDNKCINEEENIVKSVSNDIFKVKDYLMNLFLYDVSPLHLLDIIQDAVESY